MSHRVICRVQAAPEIYGKALGASIITEGQFSSATLCSTLWVQLHSTWAPPRYGPRGQLQRVFRRRVEQSATHLIRIQSGLTYLLPPNLIYPNPSVSSLAQATFQIIPNEAITQEAGQEAMLEERADHLKQFTEGIDSSQSQMISHSDTATQFQIVVLTGSTGT
ncbi:hypothetical protein N7501_011594 [Penicillium viridicatum]|nr:hypothetical protein N7501_011594 [Penicillium viridicatum]